MAKIAKKTLIKDIILGIVALVCIGAIIAANLVISMYELNITLFFTKGGYSDNIDSDERDNTVTLGDTLIEEVVADSIVLLKNQNDALPLEKGTKLNLFGWNSTDNGFMLTGGGSGGVAIAEQLQTSLTDALKDAKVEYNEKLIAAYENFNSSYNINMGNGAALDTGTEAVLLNPPESFYTDELMNEAREFSDTAVIVISRFQKENGMPFFSTLGQYKYDGSQYGTLADTSRTYLQTSTEEDAMIAKVKAKFDKVIVLLNLCNVMECGFIDDPEIDAALLVGVPGQSGAKAIPKVLFGDVAPSGRTADTYAYYTKDAPSYANAVYATNPRGKRSGISSDVRDYIKAYDNNIHYQEDVYVGYRWYETAFADKVKFTVNERVQDFSTEDGYRKIVQYPFGYGLSYTDFSWEVIEAPENGAEIDEENEFEIKVRVTNTGTREGKEVVQLYYTPPYTPGGIEKPAMNLLAFAKTVSLKPANMTEDGIAESQVVTLKFRGYDMASYDCYDRNGNDFATYELDPGKYEIKLMKNAHESAGISKDTVTLEVPGKTSDDALIFLLDPDTGELVENRFTGEDAYAGVPIDGSTVHSGGVEYMSRADFDGTFPRVRHARPDDSAAVDAASKYTYSDTSEVQPVQYNQENNMWLVLREDGGKPTHDDLNGRGVELKYNTELMEKLLADYDAPEWNKLLSQLSPSSTVDLIFNGGWGIWSNLELGLPRTNDSDGPSGFGSIFDLSGKQMSITFPSESTIACSWNTQNAYNVGRLQGLVAQNRKLTGWYAPCVNIHRSPYGSRNFESYSEDPVISGKLAAEVIRGAKHNGMRCYLKHFAMDDNGDNPWDQNLWVTEQAAREIYLRPFEIAVKEGGANAVMSSFNRVGAVWAGGNRALLTDILSTEWAFRGTIITDACNAWYMEQTKGVHAGNDLWLGERKNMLTASNQLDINNKLSAHCARESVKGIVYTYVDTIMAAIDFAENGDPNDPYKVNVDKVMTAEKPYSPLLTFLWALVNILFIAGLFCCVFFIVFPLVRKKKPQAETSACVGSVSGASDCDVGTVFGANFDTETEVRGDTPETPDETDNEAAETAPDETVETPPEKARDISVSPAADTKRTDELQALADENATLKAENAALKEQLAAFTEFAKELRAQREKQEEEAQKRKAEAKKRKAESAGKPKAPSTKQQVDELRTELEQVRDMLSKLM